MRFYNFSWLFLILFSIILFNTDDNKLVSGQCLTDQRELLLQLNQSLSSSSSSSSSALKRSSWSLNTDCCSAWVGVNCDTDGHVISLDLSSEFISDGFDNLSSLFKLQHLQNLNLADNLFLTKQLPSGFDRLANLTNLNMSYSGFSGQIPIEISRLTRLVSLDLSDNIDTTGYYCLKLDDPDLGTLIRNLSELRVLRLDSTNISAEGRKWCQAVSSSLPKLQVLSLSNCYLSGPIDKSLLQLGSSLYQIELERNNISSQVPDFFVEFSNLTSLSLRTCGLYGKLPENFFQLPKLRSLDLANNQLLHGSLPEFPQNGSLQKLVMGNTNFIGNLTLLSHLDLSNCGFNGSIPASMTNLDQLQYLDLSSNRLTGPINGSLFTLPSLQKLYLDQNQFTGRIAEFPNGSSSSLLDTLYLSNNKLQGPIPTSIFQLSNLIVLSLSSNKFNGTLSLDMFQKFRNLSILDLSGNSLSIDTGGVNPASFPQLSSLRLGSCNLGVFPDFLRNQSELNQLDLSSNQIRGKIPKSVWMIGNGIPGYLNLSNNFIEELEQPLLPPSFDWSFLEVDLHSNMLQGKNLWLPLLLSTIFLDYSNNNFTNNFTNVIPHNISSNLWLLSLSSNYLIGEIPTSICELSYLQVLDLSNNNLSGPIPQCLGTMAYLSVLNLRGNYFHGTIPHMFPEGCSLRTLDLNMNRLVGKVARSLANCTMLEVLDLGNNQISGTFPSWLGNMSKLRVLVLRSNRFHGPLRHPRRMADQNFPMLQIIDISSNNFTGNLSSQFFSSWKAMMFNEEDNKTSGEDQILRYKVLGYLYYQDTVTVTSKGLDMELVKILTIFTSIDLSNNGFEGDIPEVLGRLSSLYVLNLSQNALTSGIPTSLGNLIHLESLDLSQNKLSGEIPMQLAGLTFLSFLNLSHNHLVGKIPIGTQIQSFNATSFEGNDGLCGPPLTRICIDNGSETRISPSSSNPSNEFNWMPVSVASGFGVGIGISVCLVTFWGTRVRRSSRHH